MPGASPLGQANVEPARLQPPLPEQADGVVGIDAVGTAAVGDDLAPVRQLRGHRVERVERRRQRSRYMPGAVLRLGADVEHDDAPFGETRLQLIRGDLLDAVAFA